MKRLDLEWALKAVLPHVGRLAETAVVGLTYRDGNLYAYATDKYTAAIARIPFGMNVDVRLTPQEAGELMRFVRPDYKDEHEDDLAYAVQAGELHIGFERQVNRDGSREKDSAVFETIEHSLTLDYIMDMLVRLNDAPAEFNECIFQPRLLDKFAKAQRADFERLHILPHYVEERHGAAIVTVGHDFIGAVAGMSYDEMGTATVASFLQAERNAA